MQNPCCEIPLKNPVALAVYHALQEHMQVPLVAIGDWSQNGVTIDFWKPPKMLPYVATNRRDTLSDCYSVSIAQAGNQIIISERRREDTMQHRERSANSYIFHHNSIQFREMHHTRVDLADGQAFSNAVDGLIDRILMFRGLSR